MKASPLSSSFGTVYCSDLVIFQEKAMPNEGQNLGRESRFFLNGKVAASEDDLVVETLCHQVSLI